MPKLLQNLSLSDETLMYDRRFVVSSSGDQLYLMQRKAMSAWEVYRFDIYQKRWLRVYDLDGTVVLLSENQSSVQPHKPEFGLEGNCVIFTESDDCENVYVFRIVDQSLSLYKNKCHSGLPAWLLENRQIRYEEDDLQKDFTTNQESNCAELPDDLWRIVAESLHCPPGVAHFRVVCKSWKEMAGPPMCWKPSPTSIIESPWLMVFQENYYLHSSFTDPLDNMTYCKSTNEKLLSGCEIRYSKDGWFLVTRNSNEVFFLELFSETKIKLPDLPHGDFHVDYMAFSTSPYISDSTVIAISLRRGKLIVKYLKFNSYCCWRTIEVETPNDFFLTGCCPVYHGNMFYCLSQNGSLAIFHCSRGYYPTLTVYHNNKSFNLLSNCRRGYLVSCKNGLHLVISGLLGKIVEVYKLKIREGIFAEWNEVKSIGCFSFFISQTSSFAISTTKRAQQDTINFPLFDDQNRLICYKMDTSEFKYYNEEDNHVGGVYERKELSFGTWIQPKVTQGYR